MEVEASVGLIRDMRQLHPSVIPPAAEWMRRCANARIPIFVVETRRTWAVATAYYARGRRPLGEVNLLYVQAGLDPISSTENKSIITKAQPGQTWHLYGCAIDAVPYVDGVLDWNYNPTDPKDYFDEMAAYAIALGFSWGGKWRGELQDTPHIELHSGWTDVNEALAWYKANGGKWQIPLPKTA
jgi:hypothetical protein